MFISSSEIPEGVNCKISGRYVPISPTYDRNEFDQIYNKETHQNAFFEFISKFHQILNFFIAKLLSKLKIYGRYVPISPTYDPNEFVKIYNKDMHQNS